MSKFLNTRLALLAATALGFASLVAPAAAQTVTPTPTTAPTACTSGCPAQVTVTGLTAHMGLLNGGFGVMNQSTGALSAGTNITGTVTGSNTGGGNSNVAIDFHGCLTITCGSTTIDANVVAFQRGQIAVNATTSAPGQILTLANSGTYAAAAGLAIAFNPGSTTPTTTSTTP